MSRLRHHTSGSRPRRSDAIPPVQAMTIAKSREKTLTGRGKMIEDDENLKANEAGRGMSAVIEADLVTTDDPKCSRFAI